jgi:CHAT domain-containing protein
VSPAAGFLQAGAHATIASLWKVDDEATNKLMGYFYENMKQNMRMIDALRAAQVKLSQEPDFHHPYYWAPFILIGDWR